MSSLQVATQRDLYDYDRFPIRVATGKGTRYREAYGRRFPGNPSDYEIEAWCAARRLTVEEGGLGEFAHFKRSIQLLYPYLGPEWNHWLEMQVSCLTGPCGTHAWLGGGGIGKSWSLGTLSRIWQSQSPLTRGVMIINTTQKTQRERAWKYVIDCVQAFPWLPGEVTSSRDNPELQIWEEKPDPKRPGRMIAELKAGVGIISQTVKAGSTAKGTADLKGMHPPELLVIVEEANHLRRTRLERGRANWITNKYYQIILAGNPEIEDVHETAREDSLYHFAEPVHGWGSIEWGKNRIWENRYGGKTLHFDPFDSPRIHAPNRYKVSTWLPDRKYIEEKAKELGGQNSQLFKQQIRGIYDHEALPFNPITLSMCKKFEVYRSAKFTGMHRQRWAAFDPAYSGGDEAFLKIAESGLTEEGRIEVDFLGPTTNFVFRIDGNSPDEPSFQMMKWVRRICEEWMVPPENFIMDANVIGIGIGDILTQFWSKKINKIIVMGPATDRPMGVDGAHIAKDRCSNKQTELWMAMQALMITNQVRGLDPSVTNELIEMTAEILNGKIKVLPKMEFRKRFGYSPDRAEACIFIVDLLRTRGLAQNSKPTTVEDIEKGVADFSGVHRAEDVFVNMAGGNSDARLIDARLRGLEKQNEGPTIADLSGGVFGWKQSMF